MRLGPRRANWRLGPVLHALSPINPRRDGSFGKLGVPYFGVLIIRILLFRVLYKGPLFSETPRCLMISYVLRFVHDALWDVRDSCSTKEVAMHGTFHALVQLLALALDGLDLCSETV